MRLRSLVTVLLLLLLAAVSAVAFGLFPLPLPGFRPWGGTDPAAVTAGPEAGRGAVSETAAPSGVEAAFDVARIATGGGTSVFAGRAAPHAVVTVLADGVPVGTVEADGNGEWSLATDFVFATMDPHLSLKTAQPRARIAEAAASGGEPAPGTAAARLIGDLEKLVDKARKEAAGASPGAGTKTAATAAPLADALHSAPPVPVPITFVYREADFTESGRRAVALLLDYLKLKRFAKVSLTGHADEVGSEPYNMRLSQRRLEAVARFLREGGFEGKLELVAKGESEPFVGVDRTRTPIEELHQLDRRVEVRGLN